MRKVGTNEICYGHTHFELGACAVCTQSRKGSFCVANMYIPTSRLGKNPGLRLWGTTVERDSCGAAGSACHEPMGSPSNAGDSDILYFVTRN